MKSRDWWMLEKMHYFEGRLIRKIGSHHSAMLLSKIEPTTNCRLVFHLLFVIHAVVQLGFLASGPLLALTYVSGITHFRIIIIY
jgi:hypothetical protein